VFTCVRLQVTVWEPIFKWKSVALRCSSSKSSILLNLTIHVQINHFEPSRGICPFPWNFYVFVEFGTSDKRTNTEYFRRVQAAIENYLLHVDMIVPSNT